MAKNRPTELFVSAYDMDVGTVSPPEDHELISFEDTEGVVFMGGVEATPQECVDCFALDCMFANGGDEKKCSDCKHKKQLCCSGGEGNSGHCSSCPGARSAVDCLVVVQTAEPKMKVGIVEEDLKVINICDITEGSKIVHRGDCKRLTVSPHFETAHNKGLEGISYNPTLDVFYAVQEKNPMRVLSVDGKTGAATELFNDADLMLKEQGLTDLASCHFDAAHNSLFMLSQETRTLVRYALTGELIDKHTFEVRERSDERWTFVDHGASRSTTANSHFFAGRQATRRRSF